jgi:hypothetical protein
MGVTLVLHGDGVRLQLLVDVAYTLLDPRIDLERRSETANEPSAPSDWIPRTRVRARARARSSPARPASLWRDRTYTHAVAAPRGWSVRFLAVSPLLSFPRAALAAAFAATMRLDKAPKPPDVRGSAIRSSSPILGARPYRHGARATAP